MRRLPWGWLAALVLLVAGCGSGGTTDAAAGGDPPAIAVPTIAVSARAPAPSSPAGRLTVLVTSAGGLASPGLDALVAVLSARPDLAVVVVAPSDGTGPASGTTTLSGYPATVAGTSAAEAVDAALGGMALAPDLVVVGIGEGAAVGEAAHLSPTVAAAQAAVRHGAPALAVTSGEEHGVDFAAAGLFLGHVLDFHLDRLSADAAAHVLAIPSCTAGTVRGPQVVDRSTAAPAGPPDCTTADAEHADDVTAHAHGYATLAEHG